MKVIFVCTGNTCRSPMAEGYLKSMHLKDLVVLSRGLYAGGDAVSENSAYAMEEIGIDIKSHISKGLTPDDLDADYFICMTPSHAAALIGAGIERQKVSVLGNGIPDPFMKDISKYEECRDQIISAIDDLVFSGFFFPFTVESAKEEDIKDIARLEMQCFAEPWSENAIAESMAASTVFFIAKQNGKTAGYIGVSHAADEFYITNIAVFEEYRNMGVGTLLLNRAIVFARDNAAAFISLEVRCSNEAAIGLYKLLNFKEAGTRKNFYTNPKEDAYIFTRRFLDVDTRY